MKMKESIENELAKNMQRSFPLEERPYAKLAAALDIAESEVLDRVGEWKSDGKLREISAVMEGSVLDYDSALVCGRVDAERLQETAAIVSEHPTVTHNYERRHHWNLWFTIAVPKTMGLERHLRALEYKTGVDCFHPLRRRQTFKIGVVFDLERQRNDTQRTELHAAVPPAQIDTHFAHLARTLQTDLPVCERPFRELAHKHGLGERHLLEFARENKGGALRRYVATFRHRKLGVKANGMTVWNMPDDRLAAQGTRLAGAPEVSHCYSRVTFPGFPYNLYSMLHAPDTEALHGIVERLAGEIKCDDYLILESPTEFKKERLRYFLPELDRWHAANVESAAAYS